MCWSWSDKANILGVIGISSHDPGHLISTWGNRWQVNKVGITKLLILTLQLWYEVFIKIIILVQFHGILKEKVDSKSDTKGPLNNIHIQALKMRKGCKINTTIQSKPQITRWQFAQRKLWMKYNQNKMNITQATINTWLKYWT